MPTTRIKANDRMYNVGFEMSKDLSGQTHYQIWYNHFKAEGTDLDKVVRNFRNHIEDKFATDAQEIR